MKAKGSVPRTASNRRSFLKNGMVTAGAAAVGAALLPTGLRAFDDDVDPGKPGQPAERRQPAPGRRRPGLGELTRVTAAATRPRRPG